MKKKVRRMLLCLLLAGICLAGCKQGNESGNEGTIEDMVSKKVLRVGMECAYAPFNWTQSSMEVGNADAAVPIFGTNDYAYGYDVMVALKLAEKMGYELEIHKVEWSSIVLGMNAGDYDCIIAGMGYTTERAQAVDFTKPYYIRNNVLVVNSDGAYKDAKTMTDFAGASATTQIGTIWEQYVPQIPSVRQLTYFETTAEVIMSVAMGAADCGILDEPTAMSAAIANPEISYVKLPEEDGFSIPEGQSLNVCIAVRMGDSELLEKLDQALNDIAWNEEKMTELMNLAVQLQPLSN